MVDALKSLWGAVAAVLASIVATLGVAAWWRERKRRTELERSATELASRNVADAERSAADRETAERETADAHVVEVTNNVNADADSDVLDLADYLNRGRRRSDADPD